MDTIDAIEHYFAGDSFEIVLVDDHTSDGTYELLLAHKKSNWHIIRNFRTYGYVYLAQSLCKGYQYIAEHIQCDFILKMDTDALVIGRGLATQALEYIRRNPEVGLFGVYAQDYNRPRDFSNQQRSLDKQNALLRALFLMRPSWCKTMALAEQNGYSRGENVFGGAYFMTYACLQQLVRLNLLNVENRWYNSFSAGMIHRVGKLFGRPLPGLKGSIAEDVFFSMLAYAAGYKLGHFAAPDGPLCLEYQGLPYPAQELLDKGFKIVHSVDKGPNTSPADNNGLSAREFFRNIRRKQRQA